MSRLTGQLGDLGWRAFALLTASPEGYRRFCERNFRQRRVHGSS